MNMEEQINKAYVESKPHSFGGKYRLYDVYDKHSVDKALHKSDVYSRFKQHRHAKSFSPIYVYKKRELFQSDVVFFTRPELVEANNGYKYLYPLFASTSSGLVKNTTSDWNSSLFLYT